VLVIVFVCPGEVNELIVDPEQVLEESNPNFTVILVPTGRISFQFRVAATTVEVPLPIY
jgi:hypothetical protein